MNAAWGGRETAHDDVPTHRYKLVASEPCATASIAREQAMTAARAELQKLIDAVKAREEAARRLHE